MDVLAYVTIFGTIFAIFVSVITLFLTHFKGADITLSCENEKAMIDELKANAFSTDIPTELRVKISFFVLNKGNRTGAIRITNVDFYPDDGLAKFFKGFKYSLYSAKSSPTTPLTLQKPLIIRDGDADTIDMEYIFDLNRIIMKNYKYNLNTVDIERDNLREVLNDLNNYKKERLKEFIKFLQNSEKFGNIVLSYNHTKKQWLTDKPFKEETISLDVIHLFKETLRYYEDSFQNFKLLPSLKEIISNVLREVNSLKSTFDFWYEDIKRHRKEDDLFGFRDVAAVERKYLNDVDEDVEILKKCKNYKNIIETDVVPIIREVLAFDQKTSDAVSLPDGKKKQSLITELNNTKEPLRKKIISSTTKIKELKKIIEQELEEIS